MAPNKRQADEQARVREKILAAARDLFVDHGFEAVSLRKVAEAIGYTAPALYTHFRDKSDILAELCRSDFTALSQVFLKLGKIEDPIERIFRIGSAYIRFAKEHPNHYRLMFMTPNLAEVAPPTPEDLAAMNDPDRDAYAFLHRTVQEAIDSGRLRPEYKDAELVTQTLWAGVHGVASLEITHADCPGFTFRSLDRRSRAMCSSMLRGMMLRPQELEVSP